MIKNKKFLFIFLFFIMFFLFFSFSNVQAVTFDSFTEDEQEFIKKSVVDVFDAYKQLTGESSVDKYFIHCTRIDDGSGNLIPCLWFALGNEVEHARNNGSMCFKGSAFYCSVNMSDRVYNTFNSLEQSNYFGENFNLNKHTSTWEENTGLYANYSSHNSYYGGNEVAVTIPDDFFLVPPPEVVEEKEKTLATIVEESRPEKTLEEIINLLPLIIVVVVFLVGLRKGLALLLQILHKA